MEVNLFFWLLKERKHNEKLEVRQGEPYLQSGGKEYELKQNYVGILLAPTWQSKDGEILRQVRLV